MSGRWVDRLVRAVRETISMKYALLWLLGIPIPVLIVLYFVFH